MIGANTADAMGDAPTSSPFTIADLQAFVFRAPIEVPVTTSFGIMVDRPMVLVRIEDGEGTVGWGEVWCNFPACGAEHRARLLGSVIKPLLVGQTFHSPRQAFEAATRQTRILALQTGEGGPFAQCIAGVDLALWDLAARRAGMPLWRFLGGRNPRIGVYASGLNPDAPERLAAQKREEGYRAFKLKVGFGAERDVANMRALRRELGDGAVLMVDANQAWRLDQAVAAARTLEAFGPVWLEEPLAADVPWEAWTRLRLRTLIPLAAGENVSGSAAFDRAIASRAVSVLQPDAAKWGGISGCLPVARAAMAAGLRYCPHYLGGGVGLLASAHLLAAAGGDGLLEVDANENVLRTMFMGPLATLEKGACTLSEGPGLGVAPELADLQGLMTLRV